MKSTFLASLGNITWIGWCTNSSLISLDLYEESPLSKSKSAYFIMYISMPGYFVSSSTFITTHVFLWST
jgi:hypothetical protein